MKTNTQLGILLCCLVSLPVTAAVGEGSCAPAGERAIETGEYYERIVQTPTGPNVEVWHESNGADGLQTVRHRCGDGSSFAADVLVATLPQSPNLSF